VVNTQVFTMVPIFWELRFKTTPVQDSIKGWDRSTGTSLD